MKEKVGALKSASFEAKIVPPFKRNPSAWSQRVPIAVLASVGFFISAYLALYQWKLIPPVWDPVFNEGTAKVLTSGVSQKMHTWFGIPDAALGALAYLGDAVWGLAGSPRRWQARPWLVILFGIDVIPLGIVSAVLIFLQGYAVGSWCFLCLITAVVSLVLIVFAYDEVWASVKWLLYVKKKTGSWKELRGAFWGKRFKDDKLLIKAYFEENR